jgi:outer membrane protein OmpA-like peptidoglycan-associated protein
VVLEAFVRARYNPRRELQRQSNGGNLMRNLHMQAIIAIVAVIIAASLNTPPALAQFGAIGNAARRAQDELKQKQEADAKAKQEAEDKAKKEAADKAKKDAEAKKEQAPAAAPANAQTATTAPGPAAPAGGAAAPDFQVYSKFDFVPGEKIIAFEDFTQDSIGDFPAKWNTNASAEIVTVAGKPGRWLKLAGTGFFVPEFINALPDDFTVEFDVLTPPTFEGYPLNAVISDLPSKEAANWGFGKNSFTLRLLPGSDDAGMSETQVRQDETSAAQTTKSVKQFSKVANPVHISMWRQRQRIRVYLNEEKVWDLPRAFLTTAKLNMVVFGLRVDDPKGEYYIGNLRLAVGAPDTRNKLITDGKWVTHGILFDVNSDRVKPESYGAMKEISNVLTENADLKVQIVGHTDADGDAAQNLDLSKRRAASVRAVLAKEFGIADSRMETDGQGESQPVDKNDAPAGKANNRRVEFIKK